MKKIIALSALSLAAFSAQAAGGYYGAASIGSTSNFGTSISVAGGMKDVTKIAGSKVIPIDAEVGYINFGKKDFGFGSTSATALYGAAVGSYALNSKLDATARLGLASVTVKADVAPICMFGICVGGGSVSTSSTEFLYGVGLKYKLSPVLSVGGEYTDFGGEGVISARVAMDF